jgi:hypothetical protein
MELIKIIAEQKPDSIAALSQKTGRASSNLSRTLNRLAIFGFVTLQKRPGNVVRPIAKTVKYNIWAGRLAVSLHEGESPNRHGVVATNRASHPNRAAALNYRVETSGSDVMRPSKSVHTCWAKSYSLQRRTVFQ